MKTQALTGLLQTYLNILYLFFYPAGILYLAISMNAGPFTWGIITCCLTPPTLIWYIITTKRMEKYLAALTNTPQKKRNAEQAIEEYIESIRGDCT